MSEKKYPTNLDGLNDAGVTWDQTKSCCKRINHENVSRFETSVTWCTLPEGHDGQCSGPLPSIIEPDDLGPGASKRRRW